MKIKAPNYFQVPEACYDGAVFHIIDNGRIMAVKLVDTRFRSQMIVGRFLFADGREVKDFTLSCRRNSNGSACGVQFSNLPKRDPQFYEAYLTETDARNGNPMPTFSLGLLPMLPFGMFGDGEAVYDDTGVGSFQVYGYKLRQDLTVGRTWLKIREAKFVKTPFSEHADKLWVQLLDDDSKPLSIEANTFFAEESDAKHYADTRRRKMDAVTFPEPEKRPYNVYVHYDICVELDGVMAASKEEAEAIAKNEAAKRDLNGEVCCGIEACVMDQEEDTDWHWLNGNSLAIFTSKEPLTYLGVTSEKSKLDLKAMFGDVYTVRLEHGLTEDELKAVREADAFEVLKWLNHHRHDYDDDTAYLY